jgi:hypothetical protein
VSLRDSYSKGYAAALEKYAANALEKRILKAMETDINKARSLFSAAKGSGYKFRGESLQDLQSARQAQRASGARAPGYDQVESIGPLGKFIGTGHENATFYGIHPDMGPAVVKLRHPDSPVPKRVADFSSVKQKRLSGEGVAPAFYGQVNHELSETPVYYHEAVPGTNAQELLNTIGDRSRPGYNEASHRALDAEIQRLMRAAQEHGIKDVTEKNIVIQPRGDGYEGRIIDFTSVPAGTPGWEGRGYTPPNAATVLKRLGTPSRDIPSNVAQRARR